MMVLKQLAHELFDEVEDELREMIRKELTQFFANYPMHQQKPYLQTNEVCEIFGCCENTLKEIRIQYNIKPKKIIGTNYYRRADIDRVFNGWPE